MALGILIDQWRDYVRRYAGYEEKAAYAAVVEDLREYAREVWNPVDSEPPTAEDGEDAIPVGGIAVKTKDGCITMPVEWSAVANGECPTVVEWARISDVVMRPEGLK